MTITLTQENIYIGIILILMGIQILQWKQVNKLKDEVHKLWDQISVWNTMIAIKFLDTQKEIDKLNNKENNNGEQTKENS
jgi:Tfp pilus assembly major pilin PilA